MDSARQDPRANQKARTRAAIVEAAQGLRAETGETPTVAEAATSAGVSRATAYRYFPTYEALEIEVAGVGPDVAAIEDLLAHLSTGDVAERLVTLLDAVNPIVMAQETHFRQALWVYQDTWLRSRRSGDDDAPAVREGRRMRWLERVLEPLDLPDDEKRRLQAALALTLGGDSVVVLKDVCGLDDDEALAVLRWTALAILGTALAKTD